MYFTIDAKANYYDCDLNNRLKISAAMRYMQQTSSEHLKYLGFAPEALYEQNMVFLLTRSFIKVHDMPTAGQPIRVGTAAVSTKGPRFVREFIMESEAGVRLVSAITLWILVEPETRKILRPASFPYPIPFQTPAIDDAICKIEMPKLHEGGEGLQTVVDVRYSHLDTNGHVNNSIYADFVCDAVPFDLLREKSVDTLIVSFQNEARWGDRINMATSLLSGSEYHVLGKKADGSPCFEALLIMNSNELERRRNQ